MTLPQHHPSSSPRRRSMRQLRRPLAILPALATLLLLPAGPAAAQQDGSWSQAATGTYNYSDVANWLNGLVANGAGATANFTTASLTGPITVTLDTPRTLGALVFDNPTNSFSWSLVGTNALTLSGPAAPTIAVNNTATNASRDVTAIISAPIAGTQGFTKTGAGTLLLTGNNTGLSGGITVSGGVLSATRTATNNPLGANALTLAGGTLRVG